MRNVLRLAAVLVGGLVLAPAGADDKKKDEVVGAIWEVDFTGDKESIKLQCTTDGKVFGPKGKEIGTWKQNGAVAVIKLTDGGKRNGDYEITQLKKDPPSYRGKYTNEKGKELGITVKLVKD
jgi:hypothetical protein